MDKRTAFFFSKNCFLLITIFFQSFLQGSHFSIAPIRASIMRKGSAASSYIKRGASSFSKKFNTVCPVFKSPVEARKFSTVNLSNNNTLYNRFKTAFASLADSFKNVAAFTTQNKSFAPTISTSSQVARAFSDYKMHKVYFINSLEEGNTAHKLALDKALPVLLLENNWSSESVAFYKAIFNMVHDELTYQTMLQNFSTQVIEKMSSENLEMHKKTIVDLWRMFVGYKQQALVSPYQEVYVYKPNMLPSGIESFLLNHVIINYEAHSLKSQDMVVLRSIPVEKITQFVNNTLDKEGVSFEVKQRLNMFYNMYIAYLAAHMWKMPQAKKVTFMPQKETLDLD